jgi:hypothetical protein
MVHLRLLPCSQKSGLLHVTPFTRVLFPKFGPNGNLGLPRGFAPGNQDDPKLAENEVNEI